jgi:hypothetical protein
MMDRSRTKRRCVLLALRHGFGLVRVDASVYAISRDGAERLLVRIDANREPGRDVWTAALDVLEAMGSTANGGADG